MTLDSKIPGGPIDAKWERYKFESKLVAPANRRKYRSGYGHITGPAPLAVPA